MQRIFFELSIHNSKHLAFLEALKQRAAKYKKAGGSQLFFFKDDVDLRAIATEHDAVELLESRGL